MCSPRAAAAAAALAVIVSTLLVPAVRSEPTLPPAPVYTPSGWLTISTVGSPATVGLDTDTDGVPEATQTFAADRNCLVRTTETLLGIDGFVEGDDTDRASFASNSLGVAEKKSGTSCYQVGEPGEQLDLRLIADGARGPIGPLLASSAYLDVELKQSARILATVIRDHVEVGRFELQSGSSRGAPPLPGVNPDQVSVCNTQADSGPDAGTSDNCRWPISVPGWRGADDGIYFDTLSLKAVKGSFSVEGGGDGPVAGNPPAGYPQRASFLELVEEATGILDCEESTITESAGEDEPQVTVRRLGNADPAETCETIPYTLSNGTSSARFLKPLDEQGTAQFVFDLVWTLRDGDPVPLPNPLPVTTVDFESADPRTGIPVQWCPDPQFTGEVLTGIADPLNNAEAVDLDDALEGKQYACLGTQTSRVADGDPDTLIVTEQVYVLGDVFLRK